MKSATNLGAKMQFSTDLGPLHALTTVGNDVPILLGAPFRLSFGKQVQLMASYRVHFDLEVGNLGDLALNCTDSIP